MSRVQGHRHKSSCGGCDACCAPAGGAPEAIPGPKKEMPKDLPKGGVTNLQIDPIVTPVVAPRTTIDISGPSNPF